MNTTGIEEEGLKPLMELVALVETANVLPSHCSCHSNMFSEAGVGSGYSVESRRQASSHGYPDFV